MKNKGRHMEFNLLEILTYFLVYSILGWIMESIVRSISEKKLINTGFLKGPYCPIYGIGAIIMFSFLESFKNSVIVLFIISFIVLTLWEYLVGVLLEKTFHTKYWDYSDQKFNIQGRVCLTNSICWGVLGVVFVKYIHPFMQGLIAKIDPRIVSFIITIVSIVFIVDLISTVIKVKNIKTTLEKVEELNKEIKAKLKEIKNISINKEIQKTKNKDNLQDIIEKLKKKRNRTILHLYKNVYRLKKAFPAINTKEITEVLSKKIEFKKRKNKSQKNLK